MLIRPWSDLHLESNTFDNIPVLETDKDTVLVLAGDIGVIKKMKESHLDFLKKCCSQFRAVIYVFGNHEYWGGGSLHREHDRLRDRLSYEYLHNLHILENDKVEIDNVVFLGATLWTDYNRGNEVVRFYCQHGMNDFKEIRCGTHSEPYQRKISTSIIITEHNKSKNYLFRYAEEAKEQGKKTVIVTHHGVSHLSIHPMYVNEKELNYAYYSDLSEQILDVQPDLMIHGHVHHAFDYMIGNTRVVVNSRGYHQYGERDIGFNPTLNIELS